MHKDSLKVIVKALAALLLTLMVLMFVATNPWMLAGVAAVLLAIAAIVRAITSGPADGSPTSSIETSPPSKPTDSVRADEQESDLGEASV